MADRDGLSDVRTCSREMTLSVATTRAWIAKRKIEVVRLGRAVRIPDSEIQRLREQGTVPAIRER